MNSLWQDDEARNYPGELGQRVYSSRLLGLDPSLVLHGGGNTSIKLTETNLFGEEEEILYVKGSGWDLATIEAAGYAPVRLEPARRMAELPTLSDPDMVNALRCSMTNAGAPTPSVEAILHAIIPFKVVDHTHADAVVAITNTANGNERILEAFGDSVLIIPYVMPGFDLARLCARMISETPLTGKKGMILLNHGAFTFGDTARGAYEEMISLVDTAEKYLEGRGASVFAPSLVTRQTTSIDRIAIASLRSEVCRTAAFPMVMTSANDAEVASFIGRDDVASIANQGPATPDHSIRTKRLPMVGLDAQAYAAAYSAYFGTESAGRAGVTMLDPAPRIALTREFGMSCFGRSASDASVVADIYRHTMRIILASTALGGYKALSASEIFDVEYWDLEQAKLRKAGKSKEFAGEVALVTGSSSGIGRACVDSLLARGAAVVGLDRAPAAQKLAERADFLGLECDITQVNQLDSALDAAAVQFGGLDILVLNAGIFPKSAPIAGLAMDDWSRVFDVNLDANLNLMRLAHPLLKIAPAGGRVAIVGSKNVAAPGPGAAAYSASKAALAQLARVAALEWGQDGIRVNSVNPNAVFDTGIWTEEVLAGRAASYGLTVDEYKRNNVLRTEVTSRDVGEMVAALCGSLFAKTTGAGVPIDGGNERVI